MNAAHNYRYAIKEMNNENQRGRPQIEKGMYLPRTG